MQISRLENRDMPSLVAYLRVSTSQQGRSGLGIEAQRDALIQLAKAEGLDIAKVRHKRPARHLAARHRPGAQRSWDPDASRWDLGSDAGEEHSRSIGRLSSAHR